MDSGALRLTKEKTQRKDLDKVDLQILSTLQENSHLSYRKLATKLRISSTMAAAKIKRMENSGFLQGYTALLDPIKLGYDLTAVIFFQAEGGYIKNLTNELSQMSNVLAVYEVTGDFDIVAIVKLKDRDNLNALIKDLFVTPRIKKTITNIALNVVKEDFRLKLSGLSTIK
jgi:Lrp/AsnC family transcriptional regulator, regulator for asnA, asnC and gidA